MKRRKALGTLMAASAGVLVLPGCDYNAIPSYHHFTLDKKQWQFITRLLDLMLPTGELEIITPESRTDFVLTMLDDCHSTEDIQQFQDGLSHLMQFCKSNRMRHLKNLDTTKLQQLFQHVADAGDEGTTFFYGTARRYAIQHFTGSEYFMKNHLDYEFAPGRYEACVPV